MGLLKFVFDKFAVKFFGVVDVDTVYPNFMSWLGGETGVGTVARKIGSWLWGENYA